MECRPWDIHSTPFQSLNDLATTQLSPKSAEDKAYAAFFKAAKQLISQSVHTLSQDYVLNKQVFEILKIMEDYKSTVNNFQFLIRLLRQQEFYPEEEPSKRVKLIMIFVRLIRGLKLVQKLKSDTISIQSKGEIDRIIKYFTDVFNKTLEQIQNQKMYSVAATHLKILQSAKIECSEIGLHIEPFGDVDKVLEGLQKQRQSQEITGTPNKPVLLQDKPEKSAQTIDDSAIDSPIPAYAPVYQPVDDEEMSLWESDETLLQIAQNENKKSAPICDNPSTREIPQPVHSFDFEEQHKLIQQFLECRNELLQQNSPKDCSKHVKMIHQLVCIFTKSRRIGLGHKDSEYLRLLLRDEVALTNTGRKACLWTLCGILENVDSPLILSFADAENLDCLIGNMDIQTCNIKWCTIEFLAIRNRLCRYLAQDFLSSLESFLSRLTVTKYKIVNGSSVNLELDVFYPRNTLALTKVKSLVLTKIPKIDDVLALCKQELNKFHVQMNMKKAKPLEPPDIVCLGTPFRPPPEVVTLDSSSDSDDDE